MNKISKEQLTKLHVMLNHLGWLVDKKQIISQITSGRTESSRSLSYDEAKYLLRQLSEYDPSERIKSLVFSHAYRAGIIYGASGEDKKINAAKLNLFFMERGVVKKELNKMNYPELLKTMRQLEAIVKNNEKAKDNKAANILVGNLLEELNVNVLSH